MQAKPLHINTDWCTAVYVCIYIPVCIAVAVDTMVQNFGFWGGTAHSTNEPISLIFVLPHTHTRAHTTNPLGFCAQDQVRARQCGLHAGRREQQVDPDDAEPRRRREAGARRGHQSKKRGARRQQVLLLYPRRITRSFLNQETEVYCCMPKTKYRSG